MNNKVKKHTFQSHEENEMEILHFESCFLIYTWKKYPATHIRESQRFLDHYFFYYIYF